MREISRCLIPVKASEKLIERVIRIQEGIKLPAYLRGFYHADIHYTGINSFYQICERSGEAVRGKGWIGILKYNPALGRKKGNAKTTNVAPKTLQLLLSLKIDLMIIWPSLLRSGSLTDLGRHQSVYVYLLHSKQRLHNPLRSFCIMVAQ